MASRPRAQSLFKSWKERTTGLHWTQGPNLLKGQKKKKNEQKGLWQEVLSFPEQFRKPQSIYHECFKISFPCLDMWYLISVGGGRRIPTNQWRQRVLASRQPCALRLLSLCWHTNFPGGTTELPVCPLQPHCSVYLHVSTQGKPPQRQASLLNILLGCC